MLATFSFDKHPAVIAIDSNNIVIIIFLIVIIDATCFFIKPYFMPEDTLHYILLFTLIIMLRNCLCSKRDHDLFNRYLIHIQ